MSGGISERADRAEEIIHVLKEKAREILGSTSRRCARTVGRLPDPVRRYPYHLFAGLNVFLMLLSFPAMLLFASAYIDANFVSRGIPALVAAEGLFLGLAGVTATVYVYLGRLGFWFRRTIIRYWESNTLPFTEVEETDRRAHQIDEIPSNWKDKSRMRTTVHIILGVVTNLLGLLAIIAIGEIDWVTAGKLIKAFELLIQFLSVMFGAVPALAGVAISTTDLVEIFPFNQSLTMTLITTVVIPAFPLSIAGRNIAYKWEFRHHAGWRENKPVLIFLGGYYVFVAVFFIYRGVPEILS